MKTHSYETKVALVTGGTSGEGLISLDAGPTIKITEMLAPHD